MQKLSTNMKASVWKNFNLARTGSSNYNAGHLRGDRWLATRTFPQKEILEKFPQKSCSGMGKGNSYHAHVSYPDCRIFLSYILHIRRKKNTMFSHFYHISIFSTSFLPKPCEEGHSEIFVQGVQLLPAALRVYRN